MKVHLVDPTLLRKTLKLKRQRNAGRRTEKLDGAYTFTHFLPCSHYCFISSSSHGAVGQTVTARWCVKICLLPAGPGETAKDNRTRREIDVWRPPLEHSLLHPTTGSVRMTRSLRPRLPNEPLISVSSAPSPYLLVERGPMVAGFSIESIAVKHYNLVRH